MTLHPKIVEVIEKYLGERITGLKKAEKTARKYLKNIGLMYVEDLELKDLLSLIVVYKGDKPTEVFTGEVASVLASDTPNKIKKRSSDPEIFPGRNKSHRKYFDDILETCLKIDKSVTFRYNKTGISILKQNKTKLRLDRCFLKNSDELVAMILLHNVGDIEELKNKLPIEVAQTRTIGSKSNKDDIAFISNVPEHEIVKIIKETYLGIGSKDDYKKLDKE